MPKRWIPSWRGKPCITPGCGRNRHSPDFCYRCVKAWKDGASIEDMIILANAPHPYRRACRCEPCRAEAEKRQLLQTEGARLLAIMTGAADRDRQATIRAERSGFKGLAEELLSPGGLIPDDGTG